MGQQQLLLLVLGIVIVGIAIVVGINAYSENSIKSNFDALLQDGLRMASDAQSWKQKPEVFGGSPDATKNDAGDFTGLDYTQMAYSQDLVSASRLCYSNTNGQFNLTSVTADSVVVQGENVSNQNRVRVSVDGVLEANVELLEATSIRGGALLSTGAAPTVGPTACT